ncbi:MAG: hypothetical protein NC250_01015 [Alistipes senegalensis]|nr:hypothetical protein [Bacteroides cellulosilyticus]MCM1351301.1 hypothetical protein [Alistipes senegalensis]
MKRTVLLMVAVLVAGTVRGQMAVVAPSLETQVALNHVEQIQQAVQTYETMVGVKAGIDKGIDAVEKVNSKLTTIREVQEVADRSARCIRRIERVYKKLGDMEPGLRGITDLMTQCNQVARDCINVTAYGAKVFSPGFLRMSDAERLNETRRVLDDLDKLAARVNYIDTQANAIRFNHEMMNAYLH